MRALRVRHCVTYIYYATIAASTMGATAGKLAYFLCCIPSRWQTMVDHVCLKIVVCGLGILKLLLLNKECGNAAREGNGRTTFCLFLLKTSMCIMPV